MFVYIQPLSVTKDNFPLKEYLQLLLTYPTIFIFICILLLFLFYINFFVRIIFHYTKQFVLSYFIIFIIPNNHVIVVHTCVDVTP